MKVFRKELISFAMDFRPQETIEAALGADIEKAIPKLLRLADLHVRIPGFGILALQLLAECDRQVPQRRPRTRVARRRLRAR
jgi:hypothetical protein